MTQRRVFLLVLGAAFIALPAAEAQEPKKLYRIGTLSNASGIGAEEGFNKACASSATSKDRTSSLSGGLPRDSLIGFPISLPSWSVLNRTASSPWA